MKALLRPSETLTSEVPLKKDRGHRTWLSDFQKGQATEPIWGDVVGANKLLRLTGRRALDPDKLADWVKREFLDKDACP